MPTRPTEISSLDQQKRVFIQNFGCQMNDYDVERLTEVLRRDGYERTDDAEAADLVLINTCAIREKSEAKVASAAGRFKTWRDRPGKLLAIGGCVAQQEGAKLLRRIPHADLTFGPDQIVNVPSLLRALGTERRIAATEVIDVEDYSFLDADPRPGDVKVTALVTIQKGCDNHCAYCVVPFTRGREVSRPAGEVVAEVARFVAAGAREVTLIGQNVNSYHGVGSADGDDFAELLAMVDAVPGLQRLRFTTSHPKDFTPRVARAFAELGRLCSWLHLPVQSGSSRVLARMRRDYTVEEYLAKLDHLRALCPDISLTTDVIVGYPGETDEDHRQTLALLDRAGYESIYSFAYSPRPNTAALGLGDDVPAAVKSERLQEVQATQREITGRRLARFIGRTVEVLVEGESRAGGQACGRAPGNQMVNFAPPAGMAPADLVGRLVDVRVESARPNTLVGGELLVGAAA
jgi:tRNA-2-methylthio-N6-dimethylallyladenosine synthase